MIVPINRNVVVIGSTGSGKTVGWVIPSILSADGSIVVTDAKGTLYDLLRDRLEQQGYTVQLVDFVDTKRSTIGYEPLDYVSSSNGKPREDDMWGIATALVPVETSRDPFWDYAARGLLSSMIGFVWEALPPEEAGMQSICKLYDCIADGTYIDILANSLVKISMNIFASRLISLVFCWTRICFENQPHRKA